MDIPTPIPAQPTRFLDKVRGFIRMRLYPESRIERIGVFIPEFLGTALSIRASNSPSYWLEFA